MEHGKTLLDAATSYFLEGDEGVWGPHFTTSRNGLIAVPQKGLFALKSLSDHYLSSIIGVSHIGNFIIDGSQGSRLFHSLTVA